MGNRRRRCYSIEGGIACGPRPPTAADLEVINALRRRLAGDCTLAEARTDAGLSLGQAAKVTGIARARLELLEGGAVPTADESRVLCERYGVDGFRGAVLAPEQAATAPERTRP